MQNALSLSVSQDQTIESILQCIPFFSIGIMALGSFTVLLVLRRVNIGDMYLYLSPFLAFVAAILNLGLILAQGITGTTDPGFVRGLTIAREVCLSISLGFHFLFYWSLVAQCPRHERTLRLSSTYIHSASWKKWGFFGLLLKWSLLILTLVIPALQIIWRVTFPGTQFRIVYTIEATIEIVVSSLFLLKLLLNTLISPLSHWGGRIKPYLAPFFALLISAGLGAGNLANQVFSDTTLGRFLRAVELYILIVHNLISAFSDIPPANSLDSEKQQTLAVDHPVKAVDPPHDPPTRQSGSTAIILRNPTSIFLDESRWPSRVSKLSWVVPGDTKPVKQDTGSVVSQRVSRAELGPKRPFATANAQATPTRPRPTTNMSISSYYTMKRTSTTFYRVIQPDANRSNLESPVYGLNGIERRKPQHPRQNNSLDELFRQQNELDKTIAALGILSSKSTDTTELDFEKKPAMSAFLRPDGSSGPLSPNSPRRKHESDSNRSEFSLSNFPEPPTVIMDDTRGSVISAGITPARRRPQSIKRPIIGAFRESDDEVLVPLSRSGVGGSIDSAGRQYDVTSFIGGLTVPTAPAYSGGVVRLLDDRQENTVMKQDNVPLLLRPF